MNDAAAVTMGSHLAEADPVLRIYLWRDIFCYRRPFANCDMWSVVFEAPKLSVLLLVVDRSLTWRFPFIEHIPCRVTKVRSFKRSQDFHNAFMKRYEFFCFF